MLFKRPIKVDIITKQKKDWRPLAISIIAVIISFGTFVYSMWDLNSNRKQDLNNFFAVNQSLLSVEIGKTAMGYSEVHQYLPDTTFFNFDVTVTNISDKSCEILYMETLITTSVDSLGLYKSPREYDFDNFDIKNYKQKNGYITLLPNEKVNQFYSTTIPKELRNVRDKRIGVFVLYKNSLGGYYYAYTDGDLQWTSMEVINQTDITIPLINLRRFYHTYKVDQFPKEK